MAQHPTAPLTDDDLSRLLDAASGSEESASLRKRLSQDPEAHARFQALERQHQALQGLHADVLSEPVPQALLQSALGTPRQPGQRQGWRQWGGWAAGVLLAFAAGWLSRGAWPVQDRMWVLSVRGALPAFAMDASVAHAVYAPEQRHPVEVAASEHEHLVQWLSRRTGRSLKVPQLSGQGFALVGGRLLPGEAGARAQFMYQNAQGVRLTLYLGALDTRRQTGLQPATAFRFSSDGPVPAFYWVDEGFGYALSGALSRDNLLALAQTVYQQR